jgi:hypothetical protein
LAFKIVKIYPHRVTFSLRFFKSDRLLAWLAQAVKQLAPPHGMKGLSGRQDKVRAVRASAATI